MSEQGHNAVRTICEHWPTLSVEEFRGSHDGRLRLSQRAHRR